MLEIDYFYYQNSDFMYFNADFVSKFFDILAINSLLSDELFEFHYFIKINCFIQITSAIKYSRILYLRAIIALIDPYFYPI